MQVRDVLEAVLEQGDGVLGACGVDEEGAEGEFAGAADGEVPADFGRAGVGGLVD